MGWIGLTVIGSLLHLLAVVVRVRSFTEPMPKARPRVDVVAAAAAMVSVACLAACQLAGLEDLGRMARFAVLARLRLPGGRSRSSGRQGDQAGPSAHLKLHTHIV